MTREEFDSLPKNKQKEIVQIAYWSIFLFTSNDSSYDVIKIILSKYLHPRRKSKKSNNQTKGKGGTL